MATLDQVDFLPLKWSIVSWVWLRRHLNTAEKRFIFIITIAAFAFTISGVFAGWEAVRIAKDTTALDRIADRLWLIANINNTLCIAILNWAKPDGYLVDLAFQLDPLNFNRSLISPDAADPVRLEHGLLSVPGGLATMILAVTTGPLLLGTLLLL